MHINPDYTTDLKLLLCDTHKSAATRLQLYKHIGVKVWTRDGGSVFVKDLNQEALSSNALFEDHAVQKSHEVWSFGDDPE